MRLALTRVEAGRAVEALHLTDLVLDPKNRAALDARVKALEYLKERSEHFVEDGWLEYGITKAKEKLAPAH